MAGVPFVPLPKTLNLSIVVGLASPEIVIITPVGRITLLTGTGDPTGQSA